MNNLKVFLLILGCISFSKMNGQDFIQHQWKNRILIVQSTKGISPIYQQQIAEFMNAKEEFAERKLVLYQVVDDKYRIFDYQAKENIEEWKDAAENLNKEDDFRVILIGLDSEVKLGQTEFLGRSELFEMIDAMFMRKNELKKKKKVKN